ncbi:MAG: Gfo/Idh/MocA family oxidoreductase [Chloroflexota bacterium]
MTVAIIGSGWGTRVQVPAFRSAGLTITALVGSDQAKTERIARELGIPVALSDWRAMLERDDVSLVSIVTPPDLHNEMVQATLAAGKHVLCEKPTAMNATEAQQMLDAANAHPNQMALIDHELRFLPALIHARRLIVDGAIGQVRHALGMVIGPFRADRNREWNWWSDASRGGGLLGAISSHQIDTLRYLLGTEVTHASATLNTFITERPASEGNKPVSSDDYYSLRLQFANGALANLEGSSVALLDEPNSLTIYGDEGTLRWTNGQLLHAAAGAAFEDITPAHTCEIPEGLSGDFPQGTVYLGHALRQFVAGDCMAIATGATFTDGLHVQRTLDAARTSHAQGGGVVALS